MMSSGLPVRKIETNVETQAFWDATASGKLLLRRCDDCQKLIWYPRGYCPGCQSFNTSWVASLGTGTIYSFSVMRKGLGAWAAASPFVIAYVELTEGPRILTNIVGCDVETVHIGQAVRVTFDDTGEGSAVYRFTPA